MVINFDPPPPNLLLVSTPSPPTQLPWPSAVGVDVNIFGLNPKLGLVFSIENLQTIVPQTSWR